MRAMPDVSGSEDATAIAVARARAAAADLEATLTELCRLGLDVKAHIEPGFEEGRTSPSIFFVVIEAD